MTSVYDHPRTGNLIKDMEVLFFKDLPKTFQMAIVHYMSVDGAAWAVADEWDDWKWGEGKPNDKKMREEALKDIETFLPRFIQEYGLTRFGYGFIPYEKLIESVNGDDYFAKYSMKYSVSDSLIATEYEIPTWPVILSEFTDETLQDGWTRFHKYCQQKKTVPVTWYI